MAVGTHGWKSAVKSEDGAEGVIKAAGVDVTATVVAIGAAKRTVSVGSAN
jgi:hypothetical protein